MPYPAFRNAVVFLGLLVMSGCDSNSGGFIWEKQPGSPASERLSPVERKATNPTEIGKPSVSNQSASSQPEAMNPAEVDVEYPSKPTDDLVPFAGRVSDSPAESVCKVSGFSAPAGFKVYAAGAYAGRDLDYQIDQSGHQATRIDVAVNDAKHPVVLMLGAYEPTVWNIGWSSRTRIAAVLIGGYHRQVVAGLPENTPVLISSYDNKGPCGYFYVSQDQLGRLNPIAMKAFGQPVDMVYLAKNGSVSVGDAVSSSSLVTSSRIAPDSFRDTDAPPAGEAGLQDAVRRGLLREARSEDMAAWMAVRATVANRGLPPIAGQTRPTMPSGSIHNGYVVLKPMKIPAGLYGAHSATFFVPKGTARPTGNPGHSQIYDFNTLACAGLACREE